MLSVISMIDNEKKKAKKQLVVAVLALVVVSYLSSTGYVLELPLLEGAFSVGIGICIYCVAKLAVKIYYCVKEQPKYYSMKNVLKEQEVYKSLKSDRFDDLRKGTNVTFAFVVGCIAVFVLNMLAPNHPAIWEHLFQIKLLTYIVGLWAGYIGGKQRVRKTIEDYILANSLKLAEEKSCIVLEEEQWDRP